MRTPSVRSLLLASADSDRLHDWYCRLFLTEPDVDGFVPLGPVANS
jgi:hypothetical protein